MLFVMVGKRLVIHIRNGSFKSCQGQSPIKMDKNYLTTKHWTCRISPKFITCKTSFNKGNMKKISKIKIFPNGHMEVFVTYIFDNNKHLSKHFTKDFNMDMSNVTLTLNSNAENPAHQVVFSL